MRSLLFGSIFIGCCLSSAFAANDVDTGLLPKFGQNYLGPRVDPLDIELFGVKLGMTLTEATKAVEAEAKRRGITFHKVSVFGIPRGKVLQASQAPFTPGGISVSITTTDALPAQLYKKGQLEPTGVTTVEMSVTGLTDRDAQELGQKVLTKYGSPSLVSENLRQIGIFNYSWCLYFKEGTNHCPTLDYFDVAVQRGVSAKLTSGALREALIIKADRTSTGAAPKEF